MKKNFLPVLAFLVILVFTFLFSFHFGASVIPGWHSTLYPPYLKWMNLLVITLMLGIIRYWLLQKQADKISWGLFALHFLLTIPTVLFLQNPTILLNEPSAKPEELFKQISERLNLIPLGWTLFIIGQLIFVIYFVRTLLDKQILK